MHKLNVFNNPYYKWRYPDCWIKNIRMFCRSFKYAYQRITKGYADCDTFDLDSYYLDIFSGTLNYLADNHWGYPGNKEFPDDESWTKYLKDMAQKFYNACESNEAYPTPEGDKWWEWIEAHPNNTEWVEDKAGLSKLTQKEKNPYEESMFQEERKNEYLRDADMREGMDMLKHVMWNLWD